MLASHPAFASAPSQNLSLRTVPRGRPADVRMGVRAARPGGDGAAGSAGRVRLAALLANRAPRAPAGAPWPAAACLWVNPGRLCCQAFELLTFSRAEYDASPQLTADTYC